MIKMNQYKTWCSFSYLYLLYLFKQTIKFCVVFCENKFKPMLYVALFNYLLTIKLEVSFFYHFLSTITNEINESTRITSTHIQKNSKNV